RHPRTRRRRRQLAARDHLTELDDVVRRERPLPVERLVERDAVAEQVRARVPTIAPVRVIESMPCGGASVNRSVVACDDGRASPKSVTHTRPSLPTSTLSGLK